MTEDQEIAHSVAANGWHMIAVTDRPPPFAYTCGLMTTLGHPEFILFGLGSGTAYAILAGVVEEIRGGRSFASPGLYDGVLEGLPIAVRSVHPSWHESYLGYAMGHRRFTGDPGSLVAVQLLWPDKGGRMPYQDGCDPQVCELQPPLGREQRIG